MNRQIALTGLLALTMLAGCSKPAPPAATSPVEPGPAAAAPAPDPAAPRPDMGPADYPAKLLPFIDTAPQCEPFRAQLEAAGKSPTGEPQPVDMNEVNQVVANAAAAGCYRKP